MPAARTRVRQPRRQRVFCAAANLVRPSHFSLLLREIVRFNREAPALLSAPDAERQTLGDFLESRRFGEAFTRRYLLPMASAIWSASLDAIRLFPALTLVRFFDNHGLLSLNAQPTWKVVAGGSHTYIPKLMAQLSGDIHDGASIHAVRRGENGVTVAFRDRPSMAFDEVFSNFTTTTNVAWLHTDALVLPAQARARASWNYLLAAAAGAPPVLTYDLNRLQGLKTPEQYCVTLNPDGHVDDRRVLSRFVDHHPL